MDPHDNEVLHAASGLDGYNQGREWGKNDIQGDQRHE